MKHDTLNESDLNRSMDTYSDSRRVTSCATVAESALSRPVNMAIIRFRVVHGLEAPDIAKCVGMTPGAVRARLSRLKQIHPHPELL